MTEFDYEVRDRKQLARASRYVKRGSRSKKCTLPHDGLTKKQLKKMNGGVFVFNLNRPMSWREFRTMSEVSQREYIEGLQSKFNANAPALAEMFGVTGNCVRLYLKEVFGIVGKKGKSMTDAERDAWLDFITAPESPARGPEPEPDPEPEEVSNPTHIDNFIVEFSGMISPESIYNTLRSMLNGRSEGTVTIECKFA